MDKNNNGIITKIFTERATTILLASLWEKIAQLKKSLHSGGNFSFLGWTLSWGIVFVSNSSTKQRTTVIKN